jgi:hypothetical protein
MSWTTISPWRPIPGTGQNLTLGAASVASTVFGSSTQAVSVSAIGGNCHVTVGTAPVAGATDMLVKASDPPMIIRVSPGEKIAVIQDQSSTGTLNIIEITH